MTTRPRLIYKSALVRLGECRDSGDWAERIERGLVRISTVTLLEVGYSARSAEDMGDQFDLLPVSMMPVEYLKRAAEKRSAEVLRALAEQEQMRSISASRQ